MHTLAACVHTLPLAREGVQGTGMGSYLGTIFALPDSLFAGAVPAAAASAAALSTAALPAAADSAAAHPPAATAEPVEQEYEDRGTVEAIAEAGRGSEDAAQVQHDDARPAPEVGQTGITCRACDVGAHACNRMNTGSDEEPRRRSRACSADSSCLSLEISGTAAPETSCGTCNDAAAAPAWA